MLLTISRDNLAPILVLADVPVRVVQGMFFANNIRWLGEFAQVYYSCVHVNIDLVMFGHYFFLFLQVLLILRGWPRILTWVPCFHTQAFKGRVLPIRNGNLYGGVRPRKAGLGKCISEVWHA